MTCFHQQLTKCMTISNEFLEVLNNCRNEKDQLQVIAEFTFKYMRKWSCCCFLKPGVAKPKIDLWVATWKFCQYYRLKTEEMHSMILDSSLGCRNEPQVGHPCQKVAKTHGGTTVTQINQHFVRNFETLAKKLDFFFMKFIHPQKNHKILIRGIICININSRMYLRHVPKKFQAGKRNNFFNSINTQISIYQ
jgi:hypothetical protein